MQHLQRSSVDLYIYKIIIVYILLFVIEKSADFVLKSTLFYNKFIIPLVSLTAPAYERSYKALPCSTEPVIQQHRVVPGLSHKGA